MQKIVYPCHFFYMHYSPRNFFLSKAKLRGIMSFVGIAALGAPENTLLFLKPKKSTQLIAL